MIFHRQAIPRASGFVGVVLFGVLLGGCSEQPVPSAAAATSYPYRLIPPMVERPEDVLYAQSFDAIGRGGVSWREAMEGWFAIDFAGGAPKITAASLHPGVDFDDTGVTVRHQGVALIRFFMVPAGRGLTARASLEITDLGGAGLLDADFQAVAVREVPEGLSLAQMIELSGESGQQLLKEVAVGLASGNTASTVRWDKEQGERFGAARLFVARLKKRHLRVFAIASRLGPVSVRDVRVELAPIDRPVQPAQFRSPEEASALLLGDATPVLATLGYDRRDALQIPAGGVVSFRLDGLVGATRLTYGAALEPGDGRGSGVALRVSAGLAEARVLLDEFHVTNDRGLSSRFRDREVAIPHALQTGRATEITFENLGLRPLVLAAPIVRGRAHARHPNLLLISIDTLRSDRLGFGGYPRKTSPFLDSVAAEAAVFENYRAVAPYTLPTHVTMFTGLLPPRHGVYGLSSRVDGRQLRWLPNLLASQGYATAAFTAGGYVSPAFGFSSGFDRYGISDPMVPLHGVGLTPPRPEIRKTMDDVGDWIFERREEPWFAFVHTYATHNYFAEEETFREFDRGAESQWRDRLDEVFPQSEFAPWRTSPPTPADIDYLSDLYDATIRSVDDRLRRFFARLEGNGGLKNTVVVITSDHGEELWEHQNLRHSISVYEEMLRVPLVIWRPDGAWSPRALREPTTQADLMPTLIDLLGLPPLSDLDGASRASLVRGTGRPGSGAPLLAHVDTALSRSFALREGSLKIVYRASSPSSEPPTDEDWSLYDLAEDPGETENLADLRPRDLARLRARLEGVLDGLQQNAIDAEGATIDPALQEELEQLGYVR